MLALRFKYVALHVACVVRAQEFEILWVRALRLLKNKYVKGVVRYTTCTRMERGLVDGMAKRTSLGDNFSTASSSQFTSPSRVQGKNITEA